MRALVGILWSLFSIPVFASAAVLEPGFYPLNRDDDADAITAATAVSADGCVVVGTRLDGATARHPNFRVFRWEQGRMKRLPIWRTGGAPTALSADGSVVGGVAPVPDFSRRPLAPVFWDSGVPAWLPNPDVAGSVDAGVNGVSADGSTLVGSVHSAIVGGPAAAVWRDGELTYASVPIAGEESIAHAISADGSRIVGENRGVPVVWDDGVEWALPIPEGSTSGHATVVSADGSVISGAVWIVSIHPKQNRLARWFEDETVVTLPWFGLKGASDDGLLVGSTTYGAYARIWSESLGIRDLREFLGEVLGADVAGELAGWRLASANGISANGSVIVGEGVNPNGHAEAWMAVLEAQTCEGPGAPVAPGSGAPRGLLEAVVPRISFADAPEYGLPTNPDFTRFIHGAFDVDPDGSLLVAYEYYSPEPYGVVKVTPRGEASQIIDPNGNAAGIPLDNVQKLFSMSDGGFAFTEKSTIGFWRASKDGAKIVQHDLPPADRWGNRFRGVQSFAEDPRGNLLVVGHGDWFDPGWRRTRTREPMIATLSPSGATFPLLVPIDNGGGDDWTWVRHVEFDALGNLFVDGDPYRVARVSPDGNVDVMFGAEAGVDFASIIGTDGIGGVYVLTNSTYGGMSSKVFHVANDKTRTMIFDLEDVYGAAAIGDVIDRDVFPRDPNLHYAEVTSIRAESDVEGNVFVSVVDSRYGSLRDAILKIDPDGVITTLISEPMDRYGHFDPGLYDLKSAGAGTLIARPYSGYSPILAIPTDTRPGRRPGPGEAEPGVRHPLAHCRDGFDNDGDGKVDYPEDPGCASRFADREMVECDDGIDNDDDGAVDLDDAECRAGNDYRESCGLGFEIAIVLPILMQLRRSRSARGQGLSRP